MTAYRTNWAPPERLLLGPGPSSVPARVLQALAAPTIGHLDPAYLSVMDETRRLLRQVFATENEMTMAISGTGSAGMEACICNLIEPGDEAIVCVNGVFGGRMRDVAERYGATVHAIEAEWGRVIDPEQVRRMLQEHPRTKLLGIIHAETSTGAWQPMDDIARIAREQGVLLVVDCVTSLGGVPVPTDEWQADAIYSGTQKCLSAPPGLAPVTFSKRALEVIQTRRTKVTSWYLDVSLLMNYWGSDRVYHHTAPINMTYALRESLLMVVEEGLERRYARHLLHHRALRAGLEAMGLTYVAERSLPTLNAVAVPEGIDDAIVRKRLLNEYGIEIGAGLGPFKGRAWRIGLMGHSSSRRSVVTVLAALRSLLAEMGPKQSVGDPLDAAGEIYVANEKAS